MSFSSAQIDMFKSLVAFVDEHKLIDLKLAYRNGVILHTKVSYDFAKQVKSSVKSVSEFDEDGYPVMMFLKSNNKLAFQFKKSCLNEQEVEPKGFVSLAKLLEKMTDDELFKEITEKIDLSTMRDALVDPDNIATQIQHEEDEGQDSLQDTVMDAEDEVMKMLENALGPMTALFDKKYKEKMSRHALLVIIKGVVGTSLQAVEAYTPENEKKVMAILEENGVIGKKEKRAGKLSGYTLFTKDMHRDKKEEFKSKGLKGADVTKEIGAMWKKLSDAEKAEYNDRAKKENAENPSSSRKGSAKGSRKGSAKGSRKGSTKGEGHKCCFVISKGERKGEMCGTSVRSEEPTFEGQWLCSKHATAEKKKVESNKNKKEKSSKKSSKKGEEEKKEKKQKKKTDEEEEEEEKPKKQAKKQKKKTEEEEESSKPKKQKKVEEEEELDEMPELEEDGAEYSILDSLCKEWEEDKENCMINAKMSKSQLEKLVGKKMSSQEYEVKLSATKSSLIVKYEEDDEEEMKSIKMDKMTDDLKKVHKYINSMDDDE
jgi:hypothetical protein